MRDEGLTDSQFPISCGRSINVFVRSAKILAEESGSRTHTGPQAAPTGFEVRPPHRGRFPSVIQNRKLAAKAPRPPRRTGTIIKKPTHPTGLLDPVCISFLLRFSVFFVS